MNANDLFAAAPEPMKKWTATSLAIASSLEPGLVRLVEIRASQLNGCANCINMHAADARPLGRREGRQDGGVGHQNSLQLCAVQN